MEDELIIRRFQEKDMDQVMHVNRSSLPENYASYFFMEIYYKFPHSFLVAEINEGKIAGYCMWRLEYGISNFLPMLRRAKHAHLISIAVLEEFRRKKIGERVLLNGIKSMKKHCDVDECILEVRVSNTPAIKMYEKHNFKKIKTIKNYYKDGENAYLMAFKYED